MINRQGKLFGKISIIDILAIVAVVLIVLGVYIKFFAPSGEVVTSGHKIEYTMKFSEVRSYTVEAFQKGGTAADETTHEDMGKIVNVTAEPSKVTRDMADGSIVELEVPEKYDVYVTFQVDGKLSDTGYYTDKDNKIIGVGSRTTVNTKFAQSYGEIVSVTEVE